jgi:hypothetical protein
MRCLPEPGEATELALAYGAPERSPFCKSDDPAATMDVIGGTGSKVTFAGRLRFFINLRLSLAARYLLHLKQTPTSQEFNTHGR